MYRDILGTPYPANYLQLKEAFSYEMKGVDKENVLINYFFSDKNLSIDESWIGWSAILYDKENKAVNMRTHGWLDKDGNQTENSEEHEIMFVSELKRFGFKEENIVKVNT